MPEYVYVVSGRNTALGVYASMADALASARGAGASDVSERGASYAEATIRGEAFTVVAVRPTLSGPSPLFRE